LSWSPFSMRLLFLRATIVVALASQCGPGWAGVSRHQVLAFYYGWYGAPIVSGNWVHWKKIEPSEKRIEKSNEFPFLGAYDSHDRAVISADGRGAGRRYHGLDRELVGAGGFEDRGVPLLLEAAAKHGLRVSAYYEKVAGDDAASRKAAAAAD